MDDIKLIGSLALIWVIALASLGVICKAMFYVFMLGWNLL